MKINKISYGKQPFVQQNGVKTTSFKSSFRSVYNDNFSLKYNTNTCFFRSDLKWNNFVDYIYQKYKNVNKVNVIDYACSTGEEPVSLSMMMDLKLGNDAEKFYPIKAYDIDEDNIIKAKNGVFDVTKDELTLLRNNIGNEHKKYFICHIDSDEQLGKFRLKEEYKKNFIFNQSDIIKDFNKIPSKNTILLCRNIFPYLQIGESKKLIKQISKILDLSSVIVLGKFDIDYGIEKLFEKEGFIHTEQYNVMEKLPYYKVLFKKFLHRFKLK